MESSLMMLRELSTSESSKSEIPLMVACGKAR